MCCAIHEKYMHIIHILQCYRYINWLFLRMFFRFTCVLVSFSRLINHKSVWIMPSRGKLANCAATPLLDVSLSVLSIRSSPSYQISRIKPKHDAANAQTSNKKQIQSHFHLVTALLCFLWFCRLKIYFGTTLSATFKIVREPASNFSQPRENRNIPKWCGDSWRVARTRLWLCPVNMRDYWFYAPRVGDTVSAPAKPVWFWPIFRI